MHCQEASGVQGMARPTKRIRKAPKSLRDTAAAILSASFESVRYDVSLPSITRMANGAARLLDNFCLTIFQVEIVHPQLTAQLLFALR